MQSESQERLLKEVEEHLLEPENPNHVYWEAERQVREWGWAGYDGRFSPAAMEAALKRSPKNVSLAMFKMAAHGYLNFSISAMCKNHPELLEMKEYPLEPIGTKEQPAFRALDPAMRLPDVNAELSLFCPHCNKDVPVNHDAMYIWFRIPPDYLQYLKEEASKPGRERLRPNK